VNTPLTLTITQAAVDAIRPGAYRLCTTPAFRAAEQAIAARLLPGSEVMMGMSTTLFPPISVDTTGTIIDTDPALLRWLEDADPDEDALPDFCFRVEIPAAYLAAKELPCTESHGLFPMCAL
jgi:hypothetical protein